MGLEFVHILNTCVYVSMGNVLYIRVDDQLDERELLTIQPGETVPQQTFMGHIFVARETDGEKKAVDWCVLRFVLL